MNGNLDGIQNFSNEPNKLPESKGIKKVVNYLGKKLGRLVNPSDSSKKINDIFSNVSEEKKIDPAPLGFKKYSDLHHRASPELIDQFNEYRRGEDSDEIEIISDTEEAPKDSTDDDIELLPDTNDPEDIEIEEAPPRTDSQHVEDDLEILPETPGLRIPLPQPANPSRSDRALTKPTGINQYDIPQGGNSCFVASSLQIMMSNPSFEPMVRDGLRMLESMNSPERNQMQALKLLIGFLDVYKQGNGRAASDALLKFHQFYHENLSNRNFPPIDAPGKKSDTSVTFKAVASLLPQSKLLFAGNLNAVKTASALNPSLFENNNMLCVNPGKIESETDWQEMQTLDLPTGKYRLVGMSVGMPGIHEFAYMRRGSQWYECDDNRVRELQELKLDATHFQPRFCFYERVEE